MRGVAEEAKVPSLGRSGPSPLLMLCLPECETVSCRPKQTDACELSGLDPTVLRELQAGLVAAERLAQNGFRCGDPAFRGFVPVDGGLQIDLQRKLEGPAGIYSYLVDTCLLRLTYLVFRVHVRFLIS